MAGSSARSLAQSLSFPSECPAPRCARNCFTHRARTPKFFPMIIKPKIRGFICTPAHPEGCAAQVQEQIACVRGKGAIPGMAKRVLVIYEQGGLSHMDTWDPKPDAPVDHRSPHRPIATSVPVSGAV